MANVLDIAARVQRNLQKNRAGARQDEIGKLKQSLARQASKGGFDLLSSNDLQRLTALDPRAAENTVLAFQNLDQRRKKAFFEDSKEGLNLLNQDKIGDFQELLTERKESIEKLGGDSGDTDFIQDLFNQGRVTEVKESLAQAVELGINDGFLVDPRERDFKFDQNKRLSAKERFFQNRMDTIQDPNATEKQVAAAEIAIGLKPRAGSLSKDERAARDLELSRLIATNKELFANSTEAGKSKAALDFKGKIASSVKLAQIAATERGENLNDFNRMTAALPGLQEVVGNLRKLAPIATETLAGKGINLLSQELGFGATKGASALASYTGIIRNQVLPLLKPTFGAQFTAAEGEKLEATLGDVNATSGEKLAALDAFMQQAERNIRTKQQELNPNQEAQPLAPQAPQGPQDAGKSREEILRARLGL